MEVKNNMANLKLGLWYRDLLKKLENGEREPLFAHEILYNAILSKGTEKRPEGYTKYKAFSNEIFGIDYVLDKIMQYFSAAAQGQDIAKRILLLIGPPGSAKSTIVNMFKVILEEWTQKHPIPAIKDCPVHDNPLYAIPYNKRQEIKRYGINIGDELLPCPICQKKLQEIEWEDLEIEFISFSRTRGIGIATYAPMDPNTADDSVLIGNISLAKLAQYKEETDPRVWSYTGVLQTGNRGLVEFVEMLKAKTEHLNILLTASQDKMIVLKNLPAMYLDIIIVGHTNQPEYEKFASRPDTEAFRDRLYIVKVPYNLDYKAEIKILRKLVYPSIPTDPLVYKALAYYTVATRLAKYSEDLNTLKKLIDLMDQENKSEEALKIRKKAIQEEWGFSGLSPRKSAELLSTLMVKYSEGLSVVDVLEGIKSEFVDAPKYKNNPENKQAYDAVVSYIDEELSNYVMEAFLGTSIEEEVKSYFQNYLKNLEAYVKKVKIIDPATGEERDPDENVLQTVDSALNQISTFERRKELYERIASVIASSVIRGKTFELKDELPELYEAIKRVFFKEKIKLVGGSIDVDMPLPETKGIVRDMIENLKKAGFPERSAKLVIKRLEHMFRKERK